MAELEALYDNREEGLRYGWRYPLVVGKEVRLGRLPAESDWTMNDALVSGFHATLTWDGSRLAVRERSLPKPPKNPLYFRGVPEKEFAVPPGESFVVGHTKFFVHAAAGQVAATPVDGTMVQREQVLPRAGLTLGVVSNPSVVLRALERAPEILRLASDEGYLYREMLKVLLDAVPRADGVGVVFLPPDTPAGELRLGLRDHQQRLTPGTPDFAPSRRLVDKALRQVGQSCLYVWDTPTALAQAAAPPTHEMTLAPAANRFGGTPWALCTPFQDGSGLGLYVSGRLPVRPGKDKAGEAELTECQKVTELVVSLIESTRRTFILERQNELLRRAWPKPAHELIADPDRLEQLLEPAERQVTVLFCDLRDSVGFVDPANRSLMSAWPHLATALDEMSRTITDNDGVVAGFQGDAVMGFWGWPETLPDQVEKASRAALRIYDRLTNWHKFSCGLGVAHGAAVAGRLGAHDLAKVDVFGPVVNLASRLESLTKSFGVGILVNGEVMSHLAAADPRGGKFRLRKLARIVPKGMKTATLVGELLPGGAGTPAVEQRRRLWEQAVDWFLKGEWTQAADQLDRFFKDDPAASHLTAFMSQTARKPPENWDGGITFTTKS